MEFEKIIGHRRIIEKLKNSIKQGSTANSYIFEGPKSTGKATVARAFAKALLCKEKSQKSGTCACCVQFDNNNQPDFCEIETTESSIKKAQIEDLQRDIKIKPFSGNQKVYIIYSAEKMTIEAQNSFLKTLEEPPEYARIILITENKEKLLQTIVSRCQRIVFNYVDTKLIESYLINSLNVTLERAEFISNFSNGVVGKAILLSESEDFELLRDETLKAIDTTVDDGKEKIFSTSEFFEKNKKDIDEILDIILLYFRDLIVFSETKDMTRVINKDKAELIERHSKQLQKKSLHDIIDLVLETKENINLKVNFLLNIENMLLEMQEGRVYGSSSRS